MRMQSNRQELNLGNVKLIKFSDESHSKNREIFLASGTLLGKSGSPWWFNLYMKIGLPPFMAIVLKSEELPAQRVY